VIFGKRNIWRLRDQGNSQIQEIKAYVNGDLPASFIATGLVTFSVDAFPFYILA
jgi:hypothetical protein